MNGLLIAAAVLILSAATIHGGLGEVAVLRRIPIATLPLTQFGGRKTSMLLLRVSWHIVTLTWVVMAAVLIVAPSQGVARLIAICFAVFTLFVVPMGIATNRKLVIKHPAPFIFVAIAVTAWLGAG